MDRRWTLVVTHLVSDALLLWLGYRWLGLDESDGPHLLASFGLAAVILIGFSWLHGFSLLKFSGPFLPQAASRSLRALIPLTLLSLLAIAIYVTLAWVQAKYAQPAFVIASFLTLHFGKPIPPAAIQSIFHVILLILQWAIVPAVLLRMALKTIGRRAPERSSLTRSFPLFALIAALLLLCAIWVPLKLFYWIPNVTSFSGQMFSFILRVGFGYLLFVSCTLLLDFVTASGSPTDTQPVTALTP
jgi:hypothetical protein